MKNNDRNKFILSIVAVLLLILVIAGGTFAWWQWTSTTNTAVTFTIAGGKLTIDGGGNITGQKLVPTDQCDHETYAIMRTVTLTATNETATSMTATVNLDISGVPAALKTANLKYTFSETQSCTTGSPTGTLSGSSVQLTTFNVPAGTLPTAPLTKTYYLYIWLDSAETSTATQNQSFTITYTGALVQNAS